MARIVAGLVAGLALACGPEAPPPPAGGLPVQVLVVPDPADRDIPAYFGRAEAAREVDLDFEVAGRMLERPASLGDAVTEGQVLAKLDPRDYQAALDRAEAARDQASTRLRRVRRAARSGAVSKQEVSEAEARAESAAADVEIRQKALDDTTLRAPFEGMVAATYAEPLEEVRAGQPILRLLDSLEMHMWVNVPEDRIARASQDMPVTVRFDALPGREFAARVTEIGNEADDRTRTYPVKVRIQQPADAEVRILPGMAGEATAEPPSGTTALAALGPEVPLAAVYSGAEPGSYVWVVDASSSTVQRRDVETGPLTDRGIVIRSGLAPGERIVTQGGQFLSQGAAVRIVDPVAPEGDAS